MAKNTGAAGSKKQAREQERGAKTAQRWNRWVGVILVVAAAAGGAWWYSAEEAERPGTAMENLGQQHIPQGTPSPQYNSYPPTSGPHAGAVAWKEYADPVPHINQVHNVEHGGVLIQYNCDKRPQGTTCFDIVDALRTVYKQARRDIDKKIVLAPYPQMDRLIALTAWRRLQYFDTVEPEAILAFAKGNINRAPEEVE